MPSRRSIWRLLLGYCVFALVMIGVTYVVIALIYGLAGEWVMAGAMLLMLPLGAIGPLWLGAQFGLLAWLEGKRRPQQTVVADQAGFWARIRPWLAGALHVIKWWALLQGVACLLAPIPLVFWVSRPPTLALAWPLTVLAAMLVPTGVLAVVAAAAHWGEGRLRLAPPAEEPWPAGAPRVLRRLKGIAGVAGYGLVALANTILVELLLLIIAEMEGLLSLGGPGTLWPPLFLGLTMLVGSGLLQLWPPLAILELLMWPEESAAAPALPRAVAATGA